MFRSARAYTQSCCASILFTSFDTSSCKNCDIDCRSKMNLIKKTQGCNAVYWKLLWKSQFVYISMYILYLHPSGLFSIYNIFINLLQNTDIETHTAYFGTHWKRCKKYYDMLPIFYIHTGFALTLFELGSVGKQITVPIIYREWKSIRTCSALSRSLFGLNVSLWNQFVELKTKSKISFELIN